MFVRGVLLFILAFSFVPVLSAAETATQSSTAFGGVASRAYDQNTDGHYGKRSVTHTRTESQPWWTLDLGEQTDIGSVVVYNRTNCCTSRLSNFYVFTSEQPFVHDDVESTLSEPGIHSEYFAGAADPITTIQIDQSARYVRIQLTGSDAPLSLAEVQILKADSPAVTQSSTGFGGVASRAYDQNTNGVYNAGSVTHTNNEAQPWWTIDLGEQVEIGSVDVYNRTNCCTSRLSNFYVFTSAEPFTQVELAAMLSAPGVSHKFFAGAGAPVNTIQIDQTARYVRVQLSGTAPLSLAEVVIKEAGAITVSQSSTGWGGLATRAYDQNTNGVYRNQSVSHTTNELEPWWSIDLGEQTDISSVVIHNRTDCCTTRLSDFYVFTSDQLFAHDDVQSTLNDSSVQHEYFAGAADAVNTISINQAARYLRVQLTDKNPLSLAEVQIVEGEILLPPLAVEPLAPMSGAEFIVGDIVEFSWSLSDLATQYEFELFSSDDTSAGALSRMVVVPSECTGSACSVSTQLLDMAVYGSYTWRVRALNEAGSSEWSASTLLVYEETISKPVRPTPISPFGTDVIEDSIFAFTWEHDPTVETYEFFLHDVHPDTAGARPIQAGLRAQDLCDGTVCSYNVEVDLPVYANQRWRLRGRNSVGASDWTLTYFNVVELVTDPPVAPVTLLPQDSGRLEIDTLAQFSWMPSDKASSYEFRVLDTVSSDAFLISETILASRCTSSSCEVDVDLTLPIAITYEWQVRAINAAGQSDWSTTSFGTINKATQRPAAPVNLSPRANAELGQGDSVVFTWARDPDSVSYEFHFFDGANGTTTEFVENIQAEYACDAERCSMAQVVDLPVAANHAWRVRGKNSLGYSLNWSRTTVEVVATITETPGPFELTAPLEGTEVTEGTAVTFTWNRAQYATEYEFALLGGDVSTSEIESATLIHADCGTDFCSYTTSSQLPVSDGYIGQVRALNSIGQSAWLSTAFSIVAEPIILPDAPLAVAPMAGASVYLNQSVDFQWSADELAVSYEFYLTNSEGDALAVIDGLVPAEVCAEGVCTYTAVPALPISGLNTWHVRAVHESIESEWSETLFAIIPDTNGETPTAIISIPGYSSYVAGVAPFKVWFDPSESVDNNELTQFLWSFGDGSTTESRSSASTVEHVFTEPGSYSVQLTVTDDSGLTGAVSRSITVYDPATTPSDVDASRLLSQATFGPTRESILDVQSQGVESWLDNQFTLKGPAHLDYVAANSNGSNRAARHEVWWSDVAGGEDQLRQRVAFALSQIFVISDTGYTLSNAQFGITNYYDILREHAFGNYRELLEQVTLSPVMGLYLSMLQNAKSDDALSTRADENYAREVLQLFSIGLHQLNADGTTTGEPVFTQDIIEAFARSFTGWNYADAGTWSRAPFTSADVISPMLPFQSYHDTEPKTLLNGVTTPAGQGARADLEMALDNIFNHANVGPFISKQLIKRLVTSNPTPAYVQRIATVFNNDGYGERGNLQAVIRALLLDDEARSIPSSNTYGKLREPVLRLSNLWRAFDIQPGSNSSERGEYTTSSPTLENLDETTGQAVLKSPSVFNFFQPSYSPAGPVADNNLVSPEFELFTESNELATSNRIGRQIQEAYLANPDSTGRRNAYLDFSYERWLASDPDELLNHLDTMLMSGNLSDGFRAILLDHISGLPDTDDGLSQRVRDAVTLIMASPDYLVQM